MASGLPVVTTPVGAEGLGVKDGKEVIIKKNYKDMAKAVIEVLNSPPLATKLGGEAKKFVERNYSWVKNAELLDKIYREVVYVE